MSTSEPERLNDGAVLSDIERGYVAQGYCLPEGITWEMVHEARTKWKIYGAGCRRFGSLRRLGCPQGEREAHAPSLIPSPHEQVDGSRVHRRQASSLEGAA
jgi:hypothetical protein